MKAMKLWMLVTILFCGSTMLFTSCTNEDNAQAGDDTPSTVKAKVGIMSSRRDRYLGMTAAIPQVPVPTASIILQSL